MYTVFAGIQPLASTPLTPHSSDGAYVKWTIKNKYYTAPVHMYLHQTSKPPAKPLWPPETDDERVPAVIYVFRKGEVSLTHGLVEIGTLIPSLNDSRTEKFFSQCVKHT